MKLGDILREQKKNREEEAARKAKEEREKRLNYLAENLFKKAREDVETAVEQNEDVKWAIIPSEISNLSTMKSTDGMRKTERQDISCW